VEKRLPRGGRLIVAVAFAQSLPPGGRWQPKADGRSLRAEANGVPWADAASARIKSTVSVVHDSELVGTCTPSTATPRTPKALQVRLGEPRPRSPSLAEGGFGFAVAVTFADEGAHGKKAPSARELAAKPTEGVQRAEANGVPRSATASARIKSAVSIVHNSKLIGTCTPSTAIAVPLPRGGRLWIRGSRHGYLSS